MIFAYLHFEFTIFIINQFLYYFTKILKMIINQATLNLKKKIIIK